MGPVEEREFREFVAGRSAGLLRTAYVLTGDVHLARDLLQTALLATARRWAAIEGSPEAYVRTAMYRHQVNWWRSRARRPETVSATVPERATAGDHAADTVERHGLFDALRALPPRQRKLRAAYPSRTWPTPCCADCSAAVGAPRSPPRPCWRLRSPSRWPAAETVAAAPRPDPPRPRPRSRPGRSRPRRPASTNCPADR